MTVWMAQPKSQKNLKLLLSFSGAYLLALSLLHLLPEVYEAEKHLAGIFILLGFVAQLVLEFLSGGIEHGHFHFHSSKTEPNFPITLMISLSIHTFLECLPLGNMEEHHGIFENFSGYSLVTGIILHNIPVAVTLMSVLIQSGIKRSSAMIALLIFALTGPLGLLAGSLFEDQLLAISAHFYELSMAVVIGIFLHVSTTILFESGEGHRFNLYKFAVIALGGMLAYLTIA
ncbi:MAG: ZIP family metal transporter [Bacteroidota bacterium]